jgi:hypothetical protein
LGCIPDEEASDDLNKIAWSAIQNQDWSLSVSSAGLPSEKNENCDQSSDDQHPVLAFKAEHRKTLDQKLHRSRPQFLGRISILFVQHKRFGSANILFLYFWRTDWR